MLALHVISEVSPATRVDITGATHHVIVRGATVLGVVTEKYAIRFGRTVIHPDAGRNRRKGAHVVATSHVGRTARQGGTVSARRTGHRRKRNRKQRYCDQGDSKDLFEMFHNNTPFRLCFVRMLCMRRFVEDCVQLSSVKMILQTALLFAENTQSFLRAQSSSKNPTYTDASFKVSALRFPAWLDISITYICCAGDWQYSDISQTFLGRRAN